MCDLLRVELWQSQWIKSVFCQPSLNSRSVECMWDRIYELLSPTRAVTNIQRIWASQFVICHCQLGVAIIVSENGKWIHSGDREKVDRSTERSNKWYSFIIKRSNYDPHDDQVKITCLFPLKLWKGVEFLAGSSLSCGFPFRQCNNSCNCTCLPSLPHFITQHGLDIFLSSPLIRSSRSPITCVQIYLSFVSSLFIC